MNNTWKKLLGAVTPGGDPAWYCPHCGKGEHVMGVETFYNYTNKCPDCGKELHYPWEYGSTKFSFY